MPTPIYYRAEGFFGIDLEHPVESFWTLHAERLFANGFNCVPIHPGEKNPIGEKWQSRGCRGEVHDCAGVGVGILARSAPALDIDTDDTETALRIAECVARFVGVGAHQIVWRLSRPSRLLVPFRLEGEPFTKGVLKISSAAKVELLGDGQQFVCFGIHPKTLAPYRWFEERSLLDVPRDVLPPLSWESAVALLKALAAELSGVIEYPMHRRAAGRPITRRATAPAVAGTVAETEAVAPPHAQALMIAHKALLDLVEGIGWLYRVDRGGIADVRCPWEDEHEQGARATQGARLLPPSERNQWSGAFRCFHTTHGLKNSLAEFRAQVYAQARRAA